VLFVLILYVLHSVGGRRETRIDFRRFKERLDRATKAADLRGRSFESSGQLRFDLHKQATDLTREADRLGVQYAWNAGYDPSGFIRFFDKMAHEEGYIRGASWFRTHPPFYERMVETRREIEFLSVKEMLIYQTPAHMAIQEHLEECAMDTDREELAPCKPSLFGPTATDCPEPNLLEYEPGDPVETICRAR